jgi:hypothetical protein
MYGLGLFGYFYHFFSGALVYFACKRQFRDILPVFLWFACLFVYLEFGPSDIGVGRYLFALKQLRFLSMVTLPVCLIIAVFLARIGGKVRAILLLFLLASSVGGAWKMSEYCGAQAAPYKLAYEYLKDSAPGSVFVPDNDWALRLDFYFRTPLSEPYYDKAGSGRAVRKLTDLPVAGALKNSWLVVDTREFPAPGSAAIADAMRRASKIINVSGAIRLYYVR